LEQSEEGSEAGVAVDRFFLPALALLPVSMHEYLGS